MKVLFLESEQLYDDLLPAGLRQVGCRVQTLPEVLGDELERAIVEFQPDFALSMGWSTFPTQERLAHIRAVLDRHKEVPLVYWATEDPLWYEEWSLPYVKACRPDLVATICAEYVSRYEAQGIPAVTLPFGHNDQLFRSVEPKAEYACDIAVVANFYTTNFHEVNRKRSLHDLVTPLLEQGYDMKIWGNNWNVAPEYGVPLRPGLWQGYLNHREAPAVYNSAKIVIGLQNEFDFATNLTMRTCEVMGAGGFLLTSRTKAVEAMFRHRRHLVMSSSPDETKSLVDYYLAHPKRRHRIAAVGQEYVHEEHTYAERVRTLLAAVIRRTRVPLEVSVPAPVQEVATEPVERPVEVPVQTPTKKPVPAPVQGPAKKPVQAPGQVSGQVSVQQPVQKSVNKPVEKPIQRTVQKPVEKPVRKPVRRSVRRPVQVPDESSSSGSVEARSPLPPGPYMPPRLGFCRCYGGCRCRDGCCCSGSAADGRHSPWRIRDRRSGALGHFDDESHGWSRTTSVGRIDDGQRSHPCPLCSGSLYLRMICELCHGKRCSTGDDGSGSGGLSLSYGESRFTGDDLSGSQGDDSSGSSGFSGSALQGRTERDNWGRLGSRSPDSPESENLDSLENEGQDSPEGEGPEWTESGSPDGTESGDPDGTESGDPDGTESEDPELDSGAAPIRRLQWGESPDPRIRPCRTNLRQSPPQPARGGSKQFRHRCHVPRLR